MPEPINLLAAEEIDALIALARPIEPRIVAIDTYAGATPGANENSSEDMTTATSHARRLAEALRCVVMLVHHTNASGSRERGHSALRGAADTMLSLTAVDDALELECTKQRNGAAFKTQKLRLVVMPEGGCVLRPAAAVAASATLTSAQIKALSVLRESFLAEGATKTEWQRSLPDMQERTFYRASKALVEAGFVEHYGAKFRLTATRSEAP